PYLRRMPADFRLLVRRQKTELHRRAMYVLGLDPSLRFPFVRAVSAAGVAHLFSAAPRLAGREALPREIRGALERLLRACAVSDDPVCVLAKLANVYEINRFEDSGFSRAHQRFR